MRKHHEAAKRNQSTAATIYRHCTYGYWRNSAEARKRLELSEGGLVDKVYPKQNLAAIYNMN